MIASGLLPGLERNPGANETQIAAAESLLGRRLPADYREFLRSSNGIEGPIGAHGYLALWNTDELGPLNRDYAVNELLPGVVLLGTDGGNTGYGFQDRNDGVRYIRVPLVGMSASEVEDLGGLFSEMVEALRDLQIGDVSGQDDVDAEWTRIGELAVRERLSVSDTSCFYDEPAIVLAVAGRYAIDVRKLEIDGHEHAMAIRATRSSKPLARGRVVGEVSVAFGQLGICDRDEVEEAFEALGDAGMPTYFAQLNTTDLTGWITLPGGVRMAMVRPGFGDGTYQIFELLEGPEGRAQGIEVEFAR